MTDIVSFGEWVQTRRNMLRYNRSQFADLVGCAPITIKKIERDERRPSLEMAKLFAVHLQIPPEEEEDFLRRARGAFVSRLGTPTEMSLAEAQTPASDEESPRENLPRPTTPFFGRESELQEIANRLANPNCRLLTILAAGGMGKTRLAIEAAAHQLKNFTEGLTYVSLAPVSPDARDDGVNPLASALADALGISFLGRDTPERQLFAYLRPKEMLLVFNNFEHLLATSHFVSEILRHAPDVKILITSRERLNLQEEWLFPLQGLSYPKDLASAPESEGSAAVELFAQRAQQVRPSFDLEEEYAAVLHICRLVEGMPLGLELAAAWVFQLTCREIADEIEEEIGFLATEMRNVPERHRSLRAVFGYSWDKLSSEEQGVLQKLSVFRGGFERAAAKAVTEATLGILAGLVGKSLLSVGEDSSYGKQRTPRYIIHELLRQYAAEKLAESGPQAEEATKSQHALYFLTYLREQEPKLSGPEGLDVLAAMTLNSDNIRAAIRRGLARYPHMFDVALASSLDSLFRIKGWALEAEATCRLIVNQLKPRCVPHANSDNQEVSQNCLNLAAFLIMLAGANIFLNVLDEAEATAEFVLELIPATANPAGQRIRAEARYALSAISFWRGDYVRALNFLHGETETLEWLTGVGYLWLFNIYILTGEFSTAEKSLDMAKQLYAQSGEQITSQRLWNESAKLAMIRGQIDQAEEYFQESLARLEEIDARMIIPFVWRERGDNTRLSGNFQLAREYCQRSIAIATEISFPYPAAQGLWSLGNLAVDEGDYEAALRYYEEYKRESFITQEHIGGPGWALLGLSRDKAAGDAFAGSLRLMLHSQTRPIGLDALVGMAHVKARAGQLEEALALLALVKNHPSSYYESREKARKLWAELAAELPPERVTEAEVRGREMDLFATAESLLAEAEA